MKRLLLILLAVLLLAGCGAKTDSLEENGELCYPGLRWGMTLADAEQALGIKDYAVRKDRDNSDENVYAHIYKYYDIALEGGELFLPAKEVRLCFRGYTKEAEPMLSRVTVVYPAGTDADALQAELEKELGPGEPVEYFPAVRWKGSNIMADYMSEDYFLREAADHVAESHLARLCDPATSVSLIAGAEGHDLEMFELEPGETALEFQGFLTEELQKDPEPTRTPAPRRTAYSGEGLPVFPGTMWSMTAREVCTLLDLKDAALTDGMLTAELEFAGAPARVVFEFRTWFDELEPGLVSAEIHFTEVPDGLHDLTAESAVSDFLHPDKGDWYRELTGGDPADPAVTAALDGQVLTLRSDLTLAAQLNQMDRPDPWAEVKALFDPETGDEWYRCALECLYESPAQLDLGALFAGAVGDRVEGAELQTMLERYDLETIQAIGNVRVTPKLMEQVLDRYFGVTVEACDLDTFDESWMYCAETGSYLNLSVAGNGITPRFTAAETLDSGDTALTYEHPGYGKCTVTLRRTADRWLVVSNLKTE